MEDQRLWQTIGLAFRANKIVLGEDDILSAIRSKKAKHVFVVTDASENTRKVYKDKCDFYEIPITFLGTRAQLGAALGKEDRVAMAMTDKGFVKLILGYLQK